MTVSTLFSKMASIQFILRPEIFILYNIELNIYYYYYYFLLSFYFRFSTILSRVIIMVLIERAIRQQNGAGVQIDEIQYHLHDNEYHKGIQGT